MNKIYIVGAHSRARTLAHYLCYLHPELNIEAYLVDNDEANPSQIDGIPVIHMDENTQLDVTLPVYIGTRGVFHASITKTLQAIGMGDIRPVTVALDLELRNAYLTKYFASVGRTYTKIDDIATAMSAQMVGDDTCVYVAKSIYDKPLTDAYSLQDYEKEIQVGAALTDARLYDDILVDNAGDNISAKNKQFCELTALYWIWKNATEDIVGLVHYRRHFTMPADWQQRMLAEGVDVILPVPLFVAPSLEENYRSRHDGSDLDYLFSYIQQKDAEEYESLKAFWQNGLYSPCNMFIARREVAIDLCEWLFPILFAVAEHGGQKEDSYLNRYPGFLSERLITYFFEKNRGRYKVVFSDKNFLQ